MKKIVINKCFGGFGLSHEALRELQKLDDNLVVTDDTAMLHRETLWLNEDKINRYDRDNLNLVAVVEKLGDQANDSHAELKVIEIPDDVEYTIEEYDGVEWVAEVHRTWS
ncbi:uncharacterized protein METZ01_LOCUS503291 [marine metagenome]|uniref:Uncharacterized protein n=1 Tax=marine metagenome TaxID=408172 RepID=A0A383E0T7_9ZZZZ